MIKGKSVYKEIGNSLSTAQSALSGLGDRLQGVGGRLERSRAEESQQIARLAGIRLGGLAASQIVEDLDQVDRQVLSILEQRSSAVKQVHQGILDSEQRQQELASEHERALQARDEAGTAHATQVQATLTHLNATEEYPFQLNRVEQATRQSAHAAEKAQVSETDRERKRQPYEKDKLFSYLWKRRYRFPEYRGIPLIRTMDGWVARLCRYETAHRDFGMLLAIPDRLRAHAENVAMAAAAEAQTLAKMEQKAFEADGVPALAQALTEREQELFQAAAQIDAEEKRHETLLGERGLLAAGQDRHTKQALDTLRSHLQREDVTTLQQDAQRTSTPDDDATVAAIREHRREQERLNDDLSALQDEQAKLLSRMKELRELRSSFRQRDFDADHSVFDTGFKIQDILAGLLSGAFGLSRALARISGSQRFRRSARSWTTGSQGAMDVLGSILTSIGSNTSGSSGTFGGGGFGGSFGGGGGFSSGGGFGGGGGFSTGGGF